MEVVVVGVGCAKCHQLAANTEQALAEVDRANVAVQHVKNLDEIAHLGLVLPPALIVDGVVWSSGKVMSAESIADRLRETAARDADS